MSCRCQKNKTSEQCHLLTLWWFFSTLYEMLCAIWSKLYNFKKRQKHPWKSVTFSKVVGYRLQLLVFKIVQMVPNRTKCLCLRRTLLRLLILTISSHIYCAFVFSVWWFNFHFKSTNFIKRKYSSSMWYKQIFDIYEFSIFTSYNTPFPNVFLRFIVSE